MLRVSESQGVMIGDHNTQVSYFIAERADPGRAAGARGGSLAGRLLAEVTDPFALEVHRPVQLEDSPLGLPLLPGYVPREHDRQLEEKWCGPRPRAQAGSRFWWAGHRPVRPGRAGRRFSCSGRGRKQWRLWHPIDPSRPEASLRELPVIGPRTVVWLNEAQFYLDTPAGELGERVAAGLRELLRDPGRAPVLVLGTLWPEFWAD